MAHIRKTAQVLSEEMSFAMIRTNPGKYGIRKPTDIPMLWDIKGVDDPLAGTHTKGIDRGAAKAALNRFKTIWMKYRNSYDELRDANGAVLKAKLGDVKKLNRELEDLEKQIRRSSTELAAGKNRADVFLANKEKDKRVMSAKAEEETAKKAAMTAKEKAEYEKSGKGGYKTYKKFFAKTESFKDKVLGYINLNETKKLAGGRACEDCGSKKGVKVQKDGSWKCKGCC